MNTNEKQYPVVHMGTSFMLVILVVLCMIIFSILSLSTALTDAQYSKQRAKNITDYYTACNKAEEKLAHIYENFGQNKLDPDITVRKNGTHSELSYEIPIRKGTYLSVILEVRNKNGKTDYRIKEWNQITDDTWNTDPPHLMEK